VRDQDTVGLVVAIVALGGLVSAMYLLPPTGVGVLAISYVLTAMLWDQFRLLWLKNRGGNRPIPVPHGKLP
jgi:hypothetical protein